MKKVTKAFIYLSLIVLLIFFIFRIFRDKLAEPLYNYGLIGDSAYCDLRGGEMVSDEEYRSPYSTICRIKTKDYKKVCRDNMDCEGSCMIKNWKILADEWIVICGEFSHMRLEEFEKKVENKIDGYCSEFIFKGSCSNSTLIYVEEGIVYNKSGEMLWDCSVFKPLNLIDYK